MLFSILIAVMVVLGLILVAVILLQQGKGADAGAAFGSGASGTVFGSRGSATFLSRLTGVLMAIFMVLALVMAWLGHQKGAVHSNSVMSGASAGGTAAAAAPLSSARPARAAATGAAPAGTHPAPAPRTGQ